MESNREVINGERGMEGGWKGRGVESEGKGREEWN